MENSEQALHLCSLTKRHASLLTDFQRTTLQAPSTYFCSSQKWSALLLRNRALNQNNNETLTLVSSSRIKNSVAISDNLKDFISLQNVNVIALGSYCRSSIEVEVSNSQPPPNLPSDRVINCLHRWLSFSLRATSLSLEVIQADSSKASCIKLLLSLITTLIIHLQLYADSILIAWPFHHHHLCWLWIDLMHNSKEEQKIT